MSDVQERPELYAIAISRYGPYLEEYLWPDVHNALASKIRQQLTPKLRPRYTARLEVYVVEDSLPESESCILYPDVEVMRLDNEVRQWQILLLVLSLQVLHP